MDEDNIKDKIERLSSLSEQVNMLVSEYNEIAKSIDYETRLAIMEAFMDKETREYADDPCLSISSPKAHGWFPSQICQYY